MHSDDYRDGYVAALRDVAVMLCKCRDAHPRGVRFNLVDELAARVVDSAEAVDAGRLPPGAGRPEGEA